MGLAEEGDPPDKRGEVTQMPVVTGSPRWRVAGKNLGQFFLACALMFVLIEGVSSTLLWLYGISLNPNRLAERVHTRYDSELGWVSLPNVYVKDMYGPGIDLRTNAKGFRSNEEIEPKIPPGRRRIICSGDSFTLGYGVSNDQTWCQLLTTIDPRLQTVNMGQGGYGLDQTYLWYLHQGSILDHDIHIVALIGIDVDRMEDSSFLGYPKPVLSLRNGELVVTNVPVPRGSFFSRWLAVNAQHFWNMRTVELLYRIQRKLLPKTSPSADDSSLVARLHPVLAKILYSLATINKRKNSTLVIVYLPSEHECWAPESSQPLRSFLSEEAAARHIPYFDLTTEFLKLPEHEVKKLYILSNVGNYFGAKGHYSVAGNEFVARTLYHLLRSQPSTAEKLR